MGTSCVAARLMLMTIPAFFLLALTVPANRSCGGAACTQDVEEEQSVMLQVPSSWGSQQKALAALGRDVWPIIKGSIWRHGQSHVYSRRRHNVLAANANNSVNEAPTHSAFLVIDMQNDFLPPSGSLAVVGGEEIIPTINKLTALPGWTSHAFTQDYHPSNHISFQQSTASLCNQSYSSLDLAYTDRASLCGDQYKQIYGNSVDACLAEAVDVQFEQTLWPVHCVQGTVGAELHDDVVVPEGAATVKKGFSAVIDSYGAFLNNWGWQGGNGSAGIESNLDILFASAGVSKVYIAGLALDYCVKYSALQAKSLGYDVYVVIDATKAVNVNPDDGAKAVTELKQEGVNIIESKDLLN